MLFFQPEATRHQNRHRASGHAALRMIAAVAVFGVLISVLPHFARPALAAGNHLSAVRTVQLAQTAGGSGQGSATTPPASNTAADEKKPPAQTEQGFIQSFIYWVFEALAFAIGQILSLLIELLIFFIQYNSFVNNPVVTAGWLVVRDMANMLIVVSMLVMAFATILGMDEYSYKGKKLSRLLIMAILVNFSRTFVGVLIDIGQVVMLTFVNGFKGAAAQNLITSLNTTQMNVMSPDSTGLTLSAAQTTFTMFLTYFATCLFLLAACGVILIMTLFILKRIVVLWGVVIFSPLAFAMRGMPFKATQSYYGKWWSNLQSQILTGPVLAFFLWLSLATVKQLQFNAESGADAVFRTNFMKMDSLLSFIMALAIMYLGVDFAQQLSGGGFGGGLPGAKKLAPGAVVGGALGAIYKRTGLRQRVEGARGAVGAMMKAGDDRYKERIALTTAQYTEKIGKAREGVTPLLRGGLRQAAGRAVQGVTGGRLGAGIVKSGQEAAAEGRRIGRQLQQTGKEGQAGIYAKAQKELSKDSIEAILTGRAAEFTEVERVAALKQALEKRNAKVHDAGGAHEVIRRMKEAGADKKTVDDAVEAAKKNFPDEAFDPAALKEGETLEDKLQELSSKMAREVREGKQQPKDFTEAQIRKYANDVALRDDADRVESKLEGKQKKAYREENEKYIAEHPEESLHARQAVARTAEDAAGAAKAFDLGAGGQFGSEFGKAAFQEFVKSNGPEALSKIDASSLTKDGEPTEAMQALIDGMKGGALLGLAEKSASGTASANESALLKAVTDAIKGGWAEANRDLSRSINNPVMQIVSEKGGESGVKDRKRVERETQDAFKNADEAKSKVLSLGAERDSIQATPSFDYNGGELQKKRDLERIDKERQEAADNIGKIEEILARRGYKMPKFDATEAGMQQDVVKKAGDKAQQAQQEYDKAKTGGANPQTLEALTEALRQATEDLKAASARLKEMGGPGARPTEAPRSYGSDSSGGRGGRDWIDKKEIERAFSGVAESVSGAVKDALDDVSVRPTPENFDKLIEAINDAGADQTSALEGLVDKLKDSSQSDKSQVTRLLDAIERKLGR